MNARSYPKYAIAIGLISVVIAFVYWVVPYVGDWHLDYAGVVMLGALGIAMALMAYVLTAGSTDK